MQPAPTIEDHGPGVTPEPRERVFERSQRGDQTGRRGSGLWLTIVAEIAAAHHGRVWLGSDRRGAGVHVLLCVPVASPPVWPRPDE